MTINGEIEETYSVYPGEYKPLKFDIREARKVSNINSERPGERVVNIIECPDHYKIEITAPGHTKDDYIVMIEKGRMNIFALKRKPEIKGPLYQSHEFNYDCFEHSVLLPENIDSDFVRAEHRAGILCVCFPKTANPVLHTFHQIVVY